MADVTNTTNTNLFEGLLPPDLRETFKGLVQQVAYDAFEQGQDESSQCCGCSGTDNPYRSGL